MFHLKIKTICSHSHNPAQHLPSYSAGLERVKRQMVFSGESLENIDPVVKGDFLSQSKAEQPQGSIYNEIFSMGIQSLHVTHL